MFQPLINIHSCASVLADKALSTIIVDCRHQLANPDWGKDAFLQGHIMDAQFVHLDYDLSGDKTGLNGRHPMPSKDKLVALFSRLGINQETQVIAYDQGDMMYAARFWWLMRYMGHDRISVLDGGLNAWVREGFPMTQEIFLAQSKQFVEQESLTHLVNADFVLSNIDSQNYQVIDARGADRFLGKNETLDTIGGYIPNAKNHFFGSNLTSEGLMKSPEILNQEWAEFGDPNLLIHQCGSGVSACVNLLALAVAGHEEGMLYAGSWSEWCADESRPMVTD